MEALLLCGIYALAFSVLFYTFAAESYILSSCALIMTLYFSQKRNPWMVIPLGAIAAGITVTSVLLWALIVFLSGGKLRYRLAVLLSGGILFCLLTGISPVGPQFFGNIFSAGMGSAENYRDSYTGLPLLRMVFYVFFGSTFFYIDTQNASPFGEFQGDALSFLPSAPVPITAMMAVWVILLVLAIVRGRKDRNLWAPLAVLMFNLLLHGAIQYGLKEGFLYSLHHLFAQICLAALLVRNAEKEKTIVRCSLCLFLICEVVLNLCGYISLVQYINGCL